MKSSTTSSQYQAKELILASGLVPVGISIGEPKFALGYECVKLTRLAPWGLRELDDDHLFAALYRDRLDSIGVGMLRSRFHSISAAHDGRGLVLLCFEKPGVFCHRRVFADWWTEQTGQHVPELVAADDAQLGLFSGC